MKRLMGSMLIGLICWIALASVLMEILIPRPCIGCEDDLGAGLIAVTISVSTLVFVSMGVVLYNVAHWLRHRPKRT